MPIDHDSWFEWEIDKCDTVCMWFLAAWLACNVACLQWDLLAMIIVAVVSAKYPSRKRSKSMMVADDVLGELIS